MVKEKEKITKSNNENAKTEKVSKAKKIVKKKEKKNNSTMTFKSEFKKIKWPTKKEMVKYSISTIIFIIFFAVFFSLFLLFFLAEGSLITSGALPSVTQSPVRITFDMVSSLGASNIISESAS